MIDSHVVRVGARAVDVGYFNTKYSLGRKTAGDRLDIGVGMFPSLAPRLASNVMMHSPGTLTADGCVITIGGVRYFVGVGAVFNSTGMESHPVLPDYSVSDKYLALLRGALNCMLAAEGNPSHMVIGQLVLGLPLNNFHQYEEALQQRAFGTHVLSEKTDTAPGRRVSVENVTVMVQPQGALIDDFAMQRSKNGDLDQRNDGWVLVMDPGGGTLDWFLTKGRQADWQRSGAYPKAMLACATAVCDRINPSWKSQFEIVERVDHAIRSQADTFRVGVETYQMSEFRQSIDFVLDDSIRNMLEVVGATDNLDRILLTGGGATVYHSHINQHYPQLAKLIHMDDDPVFANVRGFQLAGEMLMVNG
jgi:plasmid segregation protein ParM